MDGYRVAPALRTMRKAADDERLTIAHRTDRASCNRTVSSRLTHGGNRTMSHRLATCRSLAQLPTLELDG
jgi:hypothetical protein